MRSARPSSLLAAASAAVLLAAADTYVVVLALTDMMAGVGLGIESLQRGTPIVSGFLLGYVSMLPLIGRLADLTDRRRVLLGCLVTFVLGSVVTALAVELPVLVAGRFVQGVGGGGLVPATLALVADLWPAHRRGMPLGVVGAVQEVGSVLGPVLGAAVLAVSDWRAIFWVGAVAGVGLWVVIRVLDPAPRPDTHDGAPARLRHPGTGRRRLGRAAALVAVATATLALWAPPRLTTDVMWGVPFVPFAGSSRVATPLVVVAVLAAIGWVVSTWPDWGPVLARADLPGALLVAVALGSVIVTFATSNPETDVVGPSGLVALPVGAVALLAAMWRHRRAADPVIPRGVVTGRTAVACLVSLLAGAALVAIVVDVPVLARLTLTDSQTDAALVLVRFLVAVPVGALAGGWALRHAAPGLVAGAGLLAAGTGMLVMAGWGRGSLAEPVGSTAVLVVVGLGMGLSIAPVNAAALERQTVATHGATSAVVVVARMVGMVVGLALLTAVGLHRYYEAVARLPDQGDTDALVAAAVVQVQTVFAGGAVAALAGAACSLALGWRQPAPSRPAGIPVAQSRNSTTTGA